MSVEEALRKLKEERKKREIEYTQIEGVLEGCRMQKLNKIQESLIGLVSIMVGGFKEVENKLFTFAEREIRTTQILSNLATKIKELENDILQLRQTLDRMVQDR